MVEHAFMDCEAFRRKGQGKHGSSPSSDNLGYLNDVQPGLYNELALKEAQYLFRNARIHIHLYIYRRTETQTL